jgi:transcriptional regulator GlxA family with amidase domain
MHLVCVLALDNVIAFDLATAVEIFRRARFADGRPSYSVIVAGPKRTVRSGPLSLGVPHRMDALAKAHTIILPGRDDPTAPIDQGVLDSIRNAHARGARVASICVGAFDLAATGLLDGHSATTHWNAAAMLSARHPLVRVDPSVLFIDGGSILTSAGAAAGLDLCLHMIESDFGAAVAQDAARLAVMPIGRGGGQAQFIPHPLARERSLSLDPVLEWISARLADQLTLDAIANVAQLSVRTVTRRFRDQLGTTPMGWLTAQRVRLARSILETTDLPVDAVATATGLGSAANLRVHLARETGTSPSAYRRAFRSSVA